MLCVCASEARKSSTWARSTAVFGPSETTVEKPTAFFLAQSRMDAVSAPDFEAAGARRWVYSGQADKAVPYYEKALLSSPENATIKANLDRARGRTGK